MIRNQILSAAHLVRAGWRGRYWRRGRSNFWRRAVIHQVFQFLAGLEERNLLRRNFDAVPRFRIPAHARLALARAEAAKTTDFDLVAHAQRAHHAVKDRIQNYFAVFAAGSFGGSMCPRVLAPRRYSVLPITFSNSRGSVQVQFPATSKDSKSRFAPPRASRVWANNRKRRQTAGRALTACLSSVARPDSARRRYSPRAPYPSPPLRSPRSDPPVSAPPPARRSRPCRSRWHGCLLLSHAFPRRLPE